MYEEPLISGVDYICLVTGYTRRLVYDNGRKYFLRFMTPNQDGHFVEERIDQYESDEIEYGDCRIASDQEHEHDLYVEDEEQQKDPCYEVVCIVDTPDGRSGGRCVFIQSDYDKIVDANLPITDYGCLIYKRIDNKKMDMMEFLPMARAIDIDFCGCYSPVHPSESSIHRKNGITMLIVEYDCESG